MPITLDDRGHDRIVANLGPVLPFFPGVLSTSHQTHVCMHLSTLEQYLVSCFMHALEMQKRAEGKNRE